MNKSSQFSEPIITFDVNGLKKDILFLKNEAVKEFRDIQEKVSEKYKEFDKEIKNELNYHEEYLNSLELKIKELSKSININNSLKENVDDLLKSKMKIEDIIFKEKIKLYNLSKDLNVNIERIDNILSDSVIYPGIIGKACKYKTFHDLIDHLLKQCSLNSLFREKNILDFKSFKAKLENLIKTFNIQSTKILESANEFTKIWVKNRESDLKNNIIFLEERMINLKTENIKFKTKLEECFNIIKEKNKEIELISKINKNKTHRASFEKNNLFFNKIEKLKLSNRGSKSQIKNYIDGIISIDELLKHKNICEIKENKDEYNTNFINKRKSVNVFEKNLKNNLFFKLLNQSQNSSNQSRKSVIFSNEIKNDLTNNEHNLTFYRSENSGENINILNQKFRKEKENVISNESIKNINIKNICDKSNKNIKIYEKSKSITNLSSLEMSSIFSKIKIKKKLKTTLKNLHQSFIESKKNNFIRANNLHYATIMEYKSRSNFNKNMIEQKKQKQRISEIRPVDNLILSSYYPNKNKDNYKIKKKI